MKSFDHIIVGSGINSLVCAAILAKKGRAVLVLERNDRLGGCIRTEEVTIPGFIHDVFSGFHPLFVTSPGYRELADDLKANGLQYVNTDAPTGAVLPDGRYLILTTSRETNIAAMNSIMMGEGDRFSTALKKFEKTLDLTNGLLGNELWRSSTFRMLLGTAWKMGLSNLAALLGSWRQSCQQWMYQNFRSDEVKALLAPWVLHAGLGPESPMSGHMAKLIAYMLEAVGMPIVKGGSEKLIEAMCPIIQSANGECQVNTDVANILIREGEAKGVRTTDGREYYAGRGVICNVTPTQLYGRLLEASFVPQSVAKQARTYRYGRGDMQIHIALNEPPKWRNPELAQVAMLHLTPGIDGVSKAVKQAESGLLPEEATVVLAQPTALDPSRAPDGKAILWVQLQELPPIIKGDAAGTINVPEGGVWAEQVRDAYAKRILDRIAVHVSNLNSAMLQWRAYSPADLEGHNINLVGGDPYSGVCSLDQFFWSRPLRATQNHDTPVRNLFHIGASTHPGPGLGGVSGYMVAKRL